MDEPLRLDVDAQIHHVEPLRPKQADDDILADVVDIPRHHADDHLPQRPGRAAGTQRLPLVQGAAVDHTGDDQVGNEIVPPLKAGAHGADAGVQALLNFLKGMSLRRHLPDGGDHQIFIQIGHCLNKLSVQIHAVPFLCVGFVNHFPRYAMIGSMYFLSVQSHLSSPAAISAFSHTS